MFHRVKSEAADTSEEQTLEMENTSNDAVNEKADEAMEAEEQEDQTSTQIEDSETMTENETPEELQEETATAAPSSFSYQRAPAASAPSSYPGSSNFAGGYGAPAAKEAASSPSGSDRRLTIGAGITMSGEIESCDYLLVEGTVEAALKGANMLDVAESGTFYGTVEIDEATISGRFEGDITVHGRLTVSATGTVTGTIVYKELEIEAGAVIDGKLTPLSALAAAKSAPKNEDNAPKTQAKKPAAAAAKSKPAESKKEAANNDGGLFSKAAAE